MIFIFGFINMGKNRKFQRDITESIKVKDYKRAVHLTDKFLKEESKSWVIVLYRLKLAYFYQDEQTYDTLFKKHKSKLFNKSNSSVLSQ